MRYAHIARRSQGNLPFSTIPPPRQFRPISKRANHAALDFRHTFQSLRASLPVIILLALPFLIGVYQFVFHHITKKRTALDRQTNSTQSLPPVPPTFDRFGYNAIRARPSASFKKSTTPVNIDLPIFFERLAKRRKFKVDPKASVSLIVACKDRTESLIMSLPSWEAVEQVDQIVVVDWSSADPPSWHDTSRMYGMMQSGRLTLAQVDNAGPWILSRAYNFAASLAVGSHILKVDCDTHLESKLLSSLTLPSVSEYYSVPFDSPRTDNENHLRGVWLARAETFRSIGGYDERIVTYGYEDADLYSRFHSKLDLTLKPLNLDHLRHNLGAHVIWHHNDSARLSRRLSTRLNEALVDELAPWHEDAVSSKSTYTLRLDSTAFVLHASIKRRAHDGMSALSEHRRAAIRTSTIRTSLHDDFSIPWDVVPALRPSDLEYLAWRLDGAEEESEERTRVVVVVLEGPDVLSNVFHLISATHMAATLQRPVIVCWNTPTVRGDGIVDRLIDLAATNAQLGISAGAKAKRGPRGEGEARLMGAGRWPCNEGLQKCATDYDKAYGAFSEVLPQGATVYDERDEIPVSTSKHTVIRLRGRIKVGNRMSRIKAFKAIVQSHAVREGQTKMGVEAEVGAVVESAEKSGAVVEALKKTYGELIKKGSQAKIPVVGPGARIVRRQLFGEAAAVGFCEEAECTLQEVVKEMASVLTISKAKAIVPELKVEDDRTEWLSDKDTTALMVEDLRALQRG